MASKKAFFEQAIKDATPNEPKAKKTWKTSGNSGGGHTGHDGKYKAAIVRPKPTGAPPPPKSLTDLP